MSTKMQRLFSLMMAVLMMLSLTACGGNATSSTPASVSGSGSESGEQVSEAAKRLEEENQLYDFRSRHLFSKNAGGDVFRI